MHIYHMYIVNKKQYSPDPVQQRTRESNMKMCVYIKYIYTAWKSIQLKYFSIIFKDLIVWQIWLLVKRKGAHTAVSTQKWLETYWGLSFLWLLISIHIALFHSLYYTETKIFVISAINDNPWIRGLSLTLLVNKSGLGLLVSCFYHRYRHSLLIRSHII